MADTDHTPADVADFAAADFAPYPAADIENMRDDFSAKPWAAECAQHGIALRMAVEILKFTKSEWVAGVERLTEGEQGIEAYNAMMKGFTDTKERLEQLAELVDKAMIRTIVAGAVIEVRED